MLTGALQISSSEEEDQGKYECVAENVVGTEYSHATMLYVKGKSRVHFEQLTVVGTEYYSHATCTMLYVKGESRVHFKQLIVFGTEYYSHATMLYVKGESESILRR